MSTVNTESDQPEVQSTRAAGVFRLMYCSVSTVAFDAEKLDALVESARSNNERHAITGVLLSNGKLNLQFVEGPEAAVMNLWHRLQADERHHCIVQIYQQSGASERLFPHWAMLRGQATRHDMLTLVRRAYETLPATNRPEWAAAVGPLLILLDSEQRRFTRAPRAGAPAG